MIDGPLQPYQRDILAFFSLRKDHNDRIVLWNGCFRWKSEMDTAPKPPPENLIQSIRGHTANILIIDESIDFPLDSIPKPSILPCLSTPQHAPPNLNP